MPHPTASHFYPITLLAPYITWNPVGNARIDLCVHKMCISASHRDGEMGQRNQAVARLCKEDNDSFVQLC